MNRATSFFPRPKGLDDAVTDEWLRAQSWAYTGGAEGASLVLGTIAGSMINIAGVVFSMTLVTLSLASSQMGPRLLRNRVARIDLTRLRFGRSVRQAAGFAPPSTIRLSSRSSTSPI